MSKTDLYFAGAEQPIYLRTLAELGVTHIAISFYEWQRRHSTDDLYKHIPKEMKVCVTAGVARKESLYWDSFGQDYVEFCERNADDCLIYDMDAPECPPEIRQGVRTQLSMFPNLVVFPTDDETPEHLSQTYERIGINASLAKSIPNNELRRLPASLYGSNVTDPKVIRDARLVGTTSFSWLSSRRYGELWVFARNKLHHYSADDLGKAVKVHTRDIEAFGVDPLACLNNDKDALTVLAVKSLQVMAESASKRPRDRNTGKTLNASGNDPMNNPMANGSTQPAALVLSNGALPVNQRDRGLLPVVSINMQDGAPKVESVDASLRQCDNCYLSTVCPKYQPETACAYELPVEIKSDAQWEAASQVLLEMQFQRISFAAFAEQLEGGGLTARLGQEMDRFYKMLGNVKALKTPDVNASSGALSRIFGAEIGTPVDGPEIEGPVYAASEEEDIIDIEEYEESGEEYADG